MSASAGLMVDLVMVMFLAIGGDTEEAMREDVWMQAGLCDKHCEWIDESPECKRQQARNLPCEVNRQRAHFWDDYFNEPDGPASSHPDTGMRLLLSPEWVPSAEPTAHRNGDGQWLKLRL